MRSDFYVYALLDPRKPGKYRYGKLKLDYEPFYVGKGCKKRSHSHTSSIKKSIVRGVLKHSYNKWKEGKIRKILESGETPIVRIIKRNQIESEAFRLETKAIRLIGRKGKGPLTNLTDGGEGTSGRIASKETRSKHTANNIKMWADLSEADYIARCLSISKGHSRRTPEEREALRARYREIQTNLPEEIATKRSKRIRKALRKYRKSMTEEQRLAESATLSRVQKAIRARETDEAKVARSAAIKRGYASKDRKQIEQKNSKIAAKIRQQHATASEYDKRMRSFSVMVGVMLRNYTDKGLIEQSNVDQIKQRLRSSAQKFYSAECNLTRKPNVLREKARVVILQYGSAA